MIAAPCPHCRRPVTPSDNTDGICPWCGGTVEAAAPPALVAAAPPAPMTHVEKPQWLLGGGLIGLLVVGAVVLTVLSLQHASDSPTEPPSADPSPRAQVRRHREAVPVAVARQPRRPAAQQAKEASPGPETVVQAEEPNPRRFVGRPRRLDIAQRPKDVGPVAKNDTTKKLPEIVELGTERKVYLPDGTYTVPMLNNKARLRIKGTVKILKVEAIENESELDVAGLDAEEIHINRVAYRCKVRLKGTARLLKVGTLENEAEIDAAALEVPEIVVGRVAYRCKVKLNSTAGNVEFRGVVDNQCTVTVLAPRGTVTFHELITNDARVTVTARQLAFKGVITGNQTQVQATLTTGGELTFREVAGTAKLEYRKANAADPPLVLQEGKVGTKAKLVQGQ
jgi:hypothetical protein